MQEHLRKITIPTADGSRHELVIPEETDYGRMERYAREQARSVREELGARLDAHDRRLGELALAEEDLSLLRWELTVKPCLISRLVAIGYPTEEAAGLVSGFGRDEAPGAVALREELASIGYTHVEIEECVEDVPALTMADIDYAKEILAAWNPETTTLNNTWNGDTRLVVFPKIDTSNVTRIESAWVGCGNLRFLPLLDTSKVTYMRTPFFYDAAGTTPPAKLRRIPAFDYSSLVTHSFGMTSFLPELEIVPPLDFPVATNLTGLFKYDSKMRNFPEIRFTDKVTNFTQAFAEKTPVTVPPISDFKMASTLSMVYAGSPETFDWEGFTIRSGAAKVSIPSFFQGARIESFPRFELNDVSDFSQFLGWASKTPKVIPDFSKWSSITDVRHALNLYDVFSLERIQGLNFASVTNATWFLYANGSPWYFPNLRYIRILNLGKGSCATYDFTQARYWGEDTPEHPDARKSLVDTLLTDSYDRTAAGLAPITVRLYSTVKNRLTDEERAAITAKGITLA